MARGCTLQRDRATLVREGQGGVNHVAFTGRIGTRPRRAARYRATFSAADADGQSTAQYLSFTVLGR